MLKGKAKTEYQREYMRKRRARVQTDGMEPLLDPEDVRPNLDIPVRPIPDALARMNKKSKKWSS